MMKKFKGLFVFIYLLLLLDITFSSEASNITTANNKRFIKTMKQAIRQAVRLAMKEALPSIQRDPALNVTSSCSSTLLKILLDAMALKIPALKLLDAMAKPAPGLIHGYLVLMGDYDECLSISVDRKGYMTKIENNEYYHGQYCTATVNFPSSTISDLKDYGLGVLNGTHFGELAPFVEEIPLPQFATESTKIRIGLCIPSVCSIADIQSMAETVGRKLSLDVDAINVDRCEDAGNSTVAPDQIGIIAMLSIIVVLGILATFFEGAMDMFHTTKDDKEKKTWQKFLMAFSIISNVKTFLKECSKTSEIKSVAGQVMFCMGCVFVYHAYLNPELPLYSSGLRNTHNYLLSKQFTFVAMMPIGMAKFFFLSGLLLAYGTFKNAEEKTNVNVLKIIVRRYLKFAVAVMILIGMIIILPLVSSGPVWKDVTEPPATNARRFWWAHLLMFNNFLRDKDVVFQYLWFIPCLMQVRVIGAVLLWILAKNRTIGIAAMVGTILMDFGVSALVTVIRNYPPVAISYFLNREEFRIASYNSPLNNLSTFVTGMLLGYYMRLNPIRPKLSKLQDLLILLSAICLTISVTAVMYHWSDGKGVGPIEAVFGGLYIRVASLVENTLLAFAVHHGYGGTFGTFLRWKGFSAVNRLTFPVYLMHIPVLMLYVGSTRTLRPYSHLEIWYLISGYAGLSYLIAFLFCILVEIPLNKIESLLMMKRQHPTLEETRNENHKFTKC